MFPLAVQFFTPESGVSNKMLDSVENADESATGIGSRLHRHAVKLCGKRFFMTDGLHLTGKGDAVLGCEFERTQVP